jgi:hypothetical protein
MNDKQIETVAKTLAKAMRGQQPHEGAQVVPLRPRKTQPATYPTPKRAIALTI